MILVDTSVWIDHFRNGSPMLSILLERQQVMTHSAIVGEITCGNLPRRAQTLVDLQRLPRARGADFREGLAFLDGHKLSGRGLGWIDIEILAASILEKVPLWSRDRRLQAAAEALGCAFTGH